MSKPFVHRAYCLICGTHRWRVRRRDSFGEVEFDSWATALHHANGEYLGRLAAEAAIVR